MNWPWSRVPENQNNELKYAKKLYKAEGNYSQMISYLFHIHNVMRSFVNMKSLQHKLQKVQAVSEMIDSDWGFFKIGASIYAPIAS